MRSLKRSEESSRERIPNGSQSIHSDGQDIVNRERTLSIESTASPKRRDSTKKGVQRLAKKEIN